MGYWSIVFAPVSTGTVTVLAKFMADRVPRTVCQLVALRLVLAPNVNRAARPMPSACPLSPPPAKVVKA